MMTSLPKGSEIIAQRGSPDYLLIKVGMSEDGHALGAVWRRGMGVFDPMYVAAIAKFGYWEPYEGSQSILAEIEKELADASAKNAAASQPGAAGDRGARPRRRKSG